MCEKFYEIEELASKDVNCNSDSPFGFVLAPDGTIYHLKQRYCHGAVIALLEPSVANEKGFGLPKKEYIDVYKFQDFELENAESLGYITVALGMFPRISFRRNQVVTEAQVKSLKTWLHNMDGMDTKFSSSMCVEKGGHAIVSQLSEMATNNKLKNGLHTSEVFSIIEPQDNLLGN